MISDYADDIDQVSLGRAMALRKEFRERGEFTVDDYARDLHRLLQPSDAEAHEGFVRHIATLADYLFTKTWPTHRERALTAMERDSLDQAKPVYWEFHERGTFFSICEVLEKLRERLRPSSPAARFGYVQHVAAIIDEASTGWEGATFDKADELVLGGGRRVAQPQAIWEQITEATAMVAHNLEYAEAKSAAMHEMFELLRPYWEGKETLGEAVAAYRAANPDDDRGFDV